MDMKYLFICFLMSAVMVDWVSAEEKPRRRRFITYDQPGARVVPEVPKELSEEVHESAGQRELRRVTSDPLFSVESGPSGGGIPAVDALPVMQLPEEGAASEEEEESWISMEDLMSTEDLINTQLDAQPNEEPEEMEIVEWEALQDVMMAGEIGDNSEAEPTLNELIEQRQEDAEAAFREEPEDLERAEDAGLQMGSVLEAQTIESAGDRVYAEDASAEVTLAPVLRPVSLAGENGVVPGTVTEVQPGTEFSGSRALLTDLQQKWDPRMRSNETAQRPQPSSVPTGQLRNPFAGPPPSSSRMGPPVSGPRVEPVIPVQTTTAPPRTSSPRQEPIRREPSTRIQSRLGADGF
jgi:hypothetical protein